MKPAIIHDLCRIDIDSEILRTKYNLSEVLS